jgi:hypothetical protein
MSLQRGSQAQLAGEDDDGPRDCQGDAGDAPPTFTFALPISHIHPLVNRTCILVGWGEDIGYLSQAN